MQDDFNRVESKVDKIVEDISIIKITLVEQHLSLKEHMRRSEANEAAIQAVADQVQPIQQNLSNVKFLLKAVGWLLSLFLSSEVVYHVIFKN